MAEDYKLRKIGSPDAERSRINELIRLLTERIAALEASSGTGSTSATVVAAASGLSSSTRLLAGLGAIQVTDGGGGGNVSVSVRGGGITSSYIGDGAVTNAKLDDMPTHTIKGNDSGSSDVPQDLTGTEVTVLLDVFGTLLKGLVPAPGSVSGYALFDDASWKRVPFMDALVDKGTITTAVTLDWTQGRNQKFTETTATNPTVTFTDPLFPGPVYIKIVAPAAGVSPTITWPANVKGSVPTTVLLAKYSDLHFHFDGTNYNYMGGTLDV